MEERNLDNIQEIDNIEQANNSLQEENELFEHFRIVVDKGQGLLRIDKFLLSRIENVSRNKIQKAAQNECIKVNGVVVKANYRVKPDDVIQVFLTTEPREIEIIPQAIPIDIVYEDNEVIVVNKPKGMVVHPAYGNYDHTLVNALTYHLQGQKTKEGEDIRPLLVHRIDKDTTGLLLVAKTEEAQTFLAKQFFDHSVDRTYTALVWGDFDEDEGVIEANVGRNLKDRKIMDTFPNGDYGKRAITHWKVLERFGYVTLIQCRLETGRTHQIRVHMKSIGHPLFDDITYGGDRVLKGTTFTKYKQFVMNCFSALNRQALHATTIGFIHPKTNEHLFFTSPLPQDMQAVIDKWKNYVYFNNDEEI